MGEMIGAIAHQWRQPLNELGINIQKLKYDQKANKIDDEFIKDFISKNRSIIDFMSKTIDDFRNFFRVDKEKEKFSIKEAIENTTSMQLAQLKNHNVVLNIKGDDFESIGFKSEFQQVILNLVNNAKDAAISNNIEYPVIDIIIKDKKVIIKDNMGGIPNDIIDRIFEPYFTTKDQGKGTGMGLYMSKLIIEDNTGGILSVKNIDGGAEFCINFN
jgi:signal transduction histidine kinase